MLKLLITAAAVATATVEVAIKLVLGKGRSSAPSKDNLVLRKRGDIRLNDLIRLLYTLRTAVLGRAD